LAQQERDAYEIGDEKERVLVNRESTRRSIAKKQLVTAMLEGRTFREVSAESPVPVKQAMAYRLLRAVRAKGNIALQDGRHGHPSKLRGEARAFLEAFCREAPSTVNDKRKSDKLATYVKGRIPVDFL
jgi:transposase